MQFKPIKYLDNKEFRNLYEMSEDGNVVRHIATQQTIEHAADAKLRRTLQDELGSTAKAFGVKTLYWASWGKPLPGTVALPEKPKASASVARKLGGKSPLVARQKDLLSKYQHGILTTLLERKQDKITPLQTLNFELSESEKKTFGSVLVYHPEKKIALMKIESQSWRGNGLWFYHLEQKKHVAFKKSTHKPGYGNDAIRWPAGSAFA